MRFAVALGYGLFDKSNKIYKGYLDQFAEFVNANRIDAVILCGGHTDPKRISESEASTMADYVGSLLKRKVRIILEDRSISTIQNIQFAGKLMPFSEKDEIIIFCDNVRPPKVMWYVLHHWFKLSKTDIEDYFVDYGLKYYRKHYTTEQIGYEIVKGMSYRRVKIKPYPLRTRLEEAVGNQTSMVIEILSLYDKRLDRKLTDSLKVKFGLE